MATEAQIEANRQNATASTGPPHPRRQIHILTEHRFPRIILRQQHREPRRKRRIQRTGRSDAKDLIPEGSLEQTFADEIIRAAWRLRRCTKVEDSLLDQSADPGLDSMANPATAATQIAVDRARLQAHRILQCCMAELRRLQNERLFRFEVVPDNIDTSVLGLASYKDLMPAMAAEKRWQLLKYQFEDLITCQSPRSFKKMLDRELGARKAQYPPPTEQTQSAPVITRVVHAITPRNAACPCGSGQKHKRCCGKDAPAVLFAAAA